MEGITVKSFGAYAPSLIVTNDDLSKLKEKTYVPELLFDNEEIVANIKNHPAALWRVREN